MKATYKNLLMALSLLHLVGVHAKSAITYTFSGGRFGDNLVAYCHAKWLSYKYNLPLLYRPFEYSNQLMMHVLETPLFCDSFNAYQKIVFLNQPDFENIEPEKDILYVVPYFPESSIELKQAKFFYQFSVDWKDAGFKAELQRMIHPLKARQNVRIENKGVAIGLHVRIGTGFDVPSIQVFLHQRPDGISHFKFPPLSYYVDQLKRFVQMYPDTDLSVYLFTDHTNPQELATYFKNVVRCDRMNFKYRERNNQHNANVLEDFFALMEFDFLIRPDANFSLIASKIGNYKMVIAPAHGIIVNNQNIIDEVTIEKDYE